MDERNYWLAFAVFSGVGPKRFKLLLEKFGTAEKAWKAGKPELAEVLKTKFTEYFLDFRSKFIISDYLRELKKHKVEFIPQIDKNYPTLLKQIPTPPIGLFVKGNFEVLQEQTTIGIVGTRRISDYGRQVTELFTQELVSAGFVIISGLAMGVDACVHQITLDQKGKTIAVLGCGVDCCYPRENERLYDEIIEKGGLIVSEFPLSMQPSIGSFPSRNRIIAGLSQAVLVTEGAEDSGALITAQDAFAIDRPVFAVPGQITSSLSKGPLNLLQQGGKMATSANDILRELQITNVQLPMKKIKQIL
ncbi:MAG TPA: DNA-processing protein DprA [Patescibacteria group bacterium]|nr:DNA-processing protein DprA [Patescibacteria group bacterium]